MKKISKSFIVILSLFIASCKLISNKPKPSEQLYGKWYFAKYVDSSGVSFDFKSEHKLWVWCIEKKFIRLSIEDTNSLSSCNDIHGYDYLYWRVLSQKAQLLHFQVYGGSPFRESDWWEDMRSNLYVSKYRLSSDGKWCEIFCQKNSKVYLCRKPSAGGT